jgi:hypothetical protein
MTHHGATPKGMGKSMITAKPTMEIPCPSLAPPSSVTFQNFREATPRIIMTARLADSIAELEWAELSEEVPISPGAAKISLRTLCQKKLITEIAEKLRVLYVAAFEAQRDRRKALVDAPKLSPPP